MDQERKVQRQKRRRGPGPQAALVGYTNAGKSTLLNKLVELSNGKEEKMVMAKDMLFATLDTTVRKISPNGSQDFLLSDTVGFISRLPHSLVKAFRSTLERPYVSRPVDTGAMRVNRRVSAAFKDVPGGQVLGATRDYSHRLLAFDLETEGAEELAEKRAELAAHFEKVAEALEAAPDVAPTASPCAEIHVGTGCFPPAGAQQGTPTKSPETAVPGAPQTPATLPRVLDYLRAQGLLAHVEADDAPPVDATMAPLSFPAPRSVRLQTLARGMTQAVEALGYAAIRGFGPAHPTVGELRSGRVAVAVDHPLEAGGEQDAYYLGSVPVTEVESVFESEGESDADGGTATATRSDGGGPSLALG